MAFQFNTTSVPLNPQDDIYRYITDIRDYAAYMNSQGLPIQYIGSWTFPLKHTYFISWQNRFCNQIAGIASVNGMLLQTPLYINGISRIFDANVTSAPVLYVELGNVSDLLADPKGGVYEMIYDPSVKPNDGSNYHWTRGAADGYSDWQYIRAFTWYDNSQNGSYSSVFYPRQAISDQQSVDVVLPFHESSSGGRSGSGNSSTATADYTGAISLRGNMVLLPYVNYSNGVDYMLFHPYFAKTTTTTPKFGRTLQRISSNNAISEKFTIVPDKTTLENFFKMWGVSVFFTLDEALGENLPEVGQSDNPEDDTPSGDGDNTSDNITIPNVISAAAPFVNQLWVNRAYLNKFREYIFGETFFNDIRRLWSSPAEAIISIVAYPIETPHVIHNIPLYDPLPATSLTIGNLTTDTVLGYGINPVAGTASMYIDMGTLDIKPYFGRYLDYDGYTEISIYMPYIGERQLNISEVMGTTLHLIYYPDFLGNTFLAILYADGQPIANYTGVMGISIPLSGTDYSQFAKDMLSNVASTIINVGGGLIKGGAAGAVTAGASGAMDIPTTQTHTKQVGAITSNTGIYSSQVPYVIISRPYISRPAAWDTLRGNAAGYSTLVENCTGYLECTEVRLIANEIMTADEQLEIENLLKGGIYI